MAPFGSAIKNGLMFTITSIIGAYLFAYFFSYGLLFLFYRFNQNDYTLHPTGILLIFASLMSAFLLIGIPFFKFLSDTVEDGLIEF